MNEEFKKIEDLYGISFSEAEMLYNKYQTIEKLIDAVNNNEDLGLHITDTKRLKKYLSSITISKPVEIKVKLTGRKCISCRKQLPEVLDKGICPYCQVVNL